MTSYNLTLINRYTAFATSIATNDDHGYSQINRNGDPDYDCSSLVIASLDYAGIPVKNHGATYTGNLENALLNSGFKRVTDGIHLRGDIGLTHNPDKKHCCIFLGNGYMVHASGVHNHPEAGDQTGKEICISDVTAFDKWFRLADESVGSCHIEVNIPMLRKGSKGYYVTIIQTMLNEKAIGDKPLVIDGDFGANTEYHTKLYQRKYNLEVDGIVGRETYTSLLGGK